ncbi:MAG: glycosyltransferase [Thermomicrobiales bacterium]
MVLDNGRGTGDFGNIRRVAMISVHTSPFATPGGKDAGGLNVYVRELSRQLGRRGIAVDVFTRRVAADMPDVVPVGDNVRIVYITAGPVAPLPKDELFPYLGAFASEMALFGLRDGMSYDVIHSHYYLSGWVAHLLGRYWAAPVVQMFHTLGALKKDAARVVGAHDGHESRQRIEIERRLIGEVDAIVAANARERAEMTWWYGQHTPKIHDIPCGIDLDLFQPGDRAAARAALGFDAAPVVLFVGRIDPVKGLEFLLDGYAALRATWTDGAPPRLVIVGGDLTPAGLGDDLARIHAQAAAKGIADGITFAGSQPHERLPEYYHAADLVVVPSRYESFGLVAVEGMACGTPVVASRVGGLPYTVEDGINGFLMPYGAVDQLAAASAHVLRDPALWAHLSAGAIATAQRFGWEQVTERILALYRTVVAQRLAPVGGEIAVYAGD